MRNTVYVVTLLSCGEALEETSCAVVIGVFRDRFKAREHALVHARACMEGQKIIRGIWAEDELVEDENEVSVMSPYRGAKYIWKITEMKITR